MPLVKNKSSRLSRSDISNMASVACIPAWTTILQHPSTDKSALMRALESGQETVKPQCSPRLKRDVLRRQAHNQLSDSPTSVWATEVETASYPRGLYFSPVLLWNCHHTIGQGTQEKSRRSMHRVIDVQTLVQAVDPEVTCELAPAFLGHSLGAPEGKPIKHS